MIGCGVSIVENMCFIEKHSFHSPLLRQVPACLLFTILEWFFLAIRGDSNPVESRMVSSLQGGTCWWHNCAASRGPILAIGKTIGNRWRCFGWKRLEGLKMEIPLKSMFCFFFLQPAGRIIHPGGPTTCHHFRCICTDGVLAVALHHLIARLRDYGKTSTSIQ